MKIGVRSIAACLHFSAWMTAPLSRRNFCDNALAQVFNSLFKEALIHHTGRWTGLAGLETVAADYAEWFNTTRLHSWLVYRTSVETETEWWCQHESAVVA